MKIALIRHFETPGNKEKRYVGRTDEPLAQGADLEERAGELKKRITASGRAEIVIASPMKRCVQTAALLFPDRKPVLCSHMRECDFGLFEGRNYEELKEVPAYKEWLASGGTLPFPGGESHPAFMERCIRGFEERLEELMTRGCTRAAMVVHGGTIMAVLSRFDREQRSFYHWQPENGGGYDISLNEKEWMDGSKIVTEIEAL